MLNRTILESAHQEVRAYQEKLAALEASLAWFLTAAPPVAASAAALTAPVGHGGDVAPAVAAPAPSAAPPRRAAEAPVRPRTTKTPDLSELAGNILTLLVEESPRRPGDLVERLGVTAPRFREALETLSDAKLVHVTGATTGRRVAITDKGRAAIGAPAAPASTPAPADTSLATPEAAAARDAAVKAHLQDGPATFESLLTCLPGTFPSREVKEAALKASLRRLSIRQEVFDVGNQFKLRRP